MQDVTWWLINVDKLLVIGILLLSAVYLLLGGCDGGLRTAAIPWTVAVSWVVAVAIAFTLPFFDGAGSTHHG
jgi:hypothetical protein